MPGVMPIWASSFSNGLHQRSSVLTLTPAQSASCCFVIAFIILYCLRCLIVSFIRSKCIIYRV